VSKGGEPWTGESVAMAWERTGVRKDKVENDDEEEREDASRR
jgi:hypothetical protein